MQKPFGTPETSFLYNTYQFTDDIVLITIYLLTYRDVKLISYHIVVIYQ